MSIEDLAQEWVIVFEEWLKSQKAILAPEMDYIVFLEKIVAKRLDNSTRIYYFWDNKLLGWVIFIQEGENAQFTLFEYEE